MDISMQYTQPHLSISNVTLLALSILLLAAPTILPMNESKLPAQPRSTEEMQAEIKILQESGNVLYTKSIELRKQQEAFNQECENIIEQKRPDIIEEQNTIAPKTFALRLTLEGDAANLLRKTDWHSIGKKTLALKAMKDVYLTNECPELNFAEKSKNFLSQRTELNQKIKMTEDNIASLRHKITLRNQIKEKEQYERFKALEGDLATLEAKKQFTAQEVATLEEEKRIAAQEVATMKAKISPANTQQTPLQNLNNNGPIDRENNNTIDHDGQTNSKTIKKTHHIPWNKSTQYGIAIAGAIGITVLVYKLINYYKSHNTTRVPKRTIVA